MRLGTAVALAVVVNRAPVVDPVADVSLDPNGCLAVVVSATDADEDPLAYAVAVGPAGLSVDGGGLVSWFPAAGDVGAHPVTVTVSDGAAAAVPVSFTVTVVATGDRLPPVLRAHAPARVLPGTAFTISARAADNVGVTSVRLEASGFVVATRTAEPYSFGFNSGTLAAELQLSLVATDAAGNETRELRTVVVDGTADTTPPSVTITGAPAEAAPGERVRVAVDATDDFGVTAVELAVAGSPRAAASSPPYVLELTVSPSAAPGALVPLVVSARDAAGNQTSTSLSLAVAATPDNQAPTGVTVSAPASAVAGETTQISGTALDDRGVLRVRFSRNGADIGDDLVPPYGVSHRVSATLSTGDSIRFEARAEDFSGNVAPATPVCAAVVAPPQGALRVVVLDDRAGRPLPGAVVTLESDPGIFAVTGPRGRASLLLPAGGAAVRVSVPGFTSARRQAVVLGNRVTRALDARLTPEAAPLEVDNLTGGAAATAEATLHYPSGALGDITDVTLTELSEQGTFAPLPLGWRPLVSFDLAPAGATNAEVELEIDCAAVLGDFSTASSMLAASYHPTQNAWVRVPLVLNEAAQTVTVRLSRLGPLALVKRDQQPTRPAEPAVGAPLIGVPPAPLPVAASALVLPQPEVVFVGAGGAAAELRSSVRAQLALSAPVPSGSVVRIEVEESYALQSGVLLSPAGFGQGLQVFQRPGRTEGVFAVTPLPAAVAQLSEGTVSLSAVRAPDGPLDGAALLGPSGGIVTSSAGVFLTVPAGALLGPTTLEVTRATGTEDPFAAAADATLLAAVDVELQADLGAAATLQVELSGGVPPASHVLLVKVVELGDIAGGTVYQLVGIGEVFGELVTFAPGALGLPLAAVEESARYLAVRVDSPIGFVTGEVTDGGPPSAGAVVTSSTLPVVGISTATAPFYVTAGRVGDSTIEGRSFVTGHAASADLQVVDALSVTARDLALVESGPTVVAVKPADGAASVSLTTAVAVDFSTVMDAATLAGGAVRLTSGGATVLTALVVSADSRRVVLRPAAALTENAAFEIVMETAAADTFGQPLRGSQPDGSHRTTFSTVDVTPPSAPAPGSVTARIPEGGTTTIEGGVGAVEGGSTVAAVNETTGETTTVIAGADGSFSITAAAQRTDNFSLTVIDENGNQTTVALGLFRNPDGTTLVGSAGGVVTGPLGLQAVVPTGSVPDGTEIRLGALPQSAFLVTPPITHEFMRGVSVEMGAVVATKPFKLSFPAPTGIDAAAQISVFREIDFIGRSEIELVEIAALKDGRITTASPPLPGIGFSGDFFFALANETIAYAQGILSSAYDGVVGLLVGSDVTHTAAVIDPGSRSFNPLQPPNQMSFFVPANQQFDAEIVDGGGNIVQLVPFTRIADWQGIPHVFIPGPPSDPPFRVLVSVPARHEHDTSIVEPIVIQFSEVLVAPISEEGISDVSPIEVCEELNEEANCVCVHETANEDCIAGEISIEKDPAQVESILLFEPDRHLRPNTEYTVNLLGVQDGTLAMGVIDNPSQNLEFKTFEPRSLGALPLPQQGELRDVINAGKKRAVLAAGRAGDRRAALSLMDVSRPEAPRLLKAVEVENVPNGVAVVPSAGTILSVHQALELRGRVRLWSPSLNPLGTKILTASTQDLAVGTFPGNIKFAGLPWDVAVQGTAGGGGNVYVATIGVGVQAVTTLSIVLGGPSTPGNAPISAPVAVATMRNTVLAGDFEDFYVFDSSLQATLGRANEPVFAIRPIPGLGVDRNGDGTFEPTEFFDFAYTLARRPGSTDLVIFQLNDGKPSVASRISLPGSERPDDLEVDPFLGVTFVARPGDLLFVDTSKPFEGGFIDSDTDGVDDRVLGYGQNLTSRGSRIALSENRTVGYVTDPGRSTFRVVALTSDEERKREIRRIKPFEDRNNPDIFDERDIGEVSASNGEYKLSVTDLTSRSPGMDFAFTRTYRSQNRRTGPLGFNWDHSYNVFLRLIHEESPAAGAEDGETDLILLRVRLHDGAGRTTIFDRDADTGTFSATDGLLARLEHDEQTESFTLHYPDGTTHFFAPSEDRPIDVYHMEVIADRNGNEMRFEYSLGGDDRERLVSIFDTLGRQIVLEHDPRGRIATVRDFGGRAVDYTYDIQGDLVAVTSPETSDFPVGVTTAYLYSSGFDEFNPDGTPADTGHLNHNLLEIVDGRGSITLVNVYSAEEDKSSINFDTLEQQTTGCPGDSGGTYTFSYDGVLGKTTTVNPAGHTTFRTYDQSGRPTSVTTLTAAHGQVAVTTQYNELGLVKSVAQPSGITTSYTYVGDTDPNAPPERLGDLVTMSVSPAGAGGAPLTTVFQTGKFGQPLAITDPGGAVTQYSLDEFGNVQRVTYGNSGVSENYTYYATGQVQTHQNNWGGVTSYALNENGYVSAVTSPEGDLTTYSHDDFGNVTEIVDPRGDVTSIGVNALNRPELIENWRGAQTIFYDANQNVTSTVQEYSDGSSGLTVETTYSCLNQPTRRTESPEDAPPRTTEIEHDGLGRIVLERSPLGHEVVSTYDEFGRVRTRSTRGGPNAVLGIAHEWFYDPDGRLRAFTSDPSGIGATRILTYDEYGRCRWRSKPASIWCSSALS